MLVFLSFEAPIWRQTMSVQEMRQLMKATFLAASLHTYEDDIFTLLRYLKTEK